MKNPNAIAILLVPSKHKAHLHFTSSFPGLNRFIAQDVKINGDGAGFDYISLDGTVETIAHGRPVGVRDAAIGFPVQTIIEPMQVAPPGPLGAKSASIVFPQHIRVATFMFNDTKGGEINGTPIQLNPELNASFT